MALAALRMNAIGYIGVDDYVKPSTVAALAIYLLLGLEDEELVEVAAEALGLASPLGAAVARHKAGRVEARLRQAMAGSALMVMHDGRARWSAIPKALRVRVRRALEFLEDKRAFGRHLVYWRYGGRGSRRVKLYTAHVGVLLIHYIALLESPYEEDRRGAEELRARYPELEDLRRGLIKTLLERVSRQLRSLGDGHGHMFQSPPEHVPRPLGDGGRTQLGTQPWVPLDVHGTQPSECRHDELEGIIAKARRLREEGYCVKVERHGRRTKVFAQRPGSKAAFIGSTSWTVEVVKRALAEAGLMRPRKL